jgi:hypothetical protein
MKSETEEKDSKHEADFYDWWDTLESKVTLAERTSQAAEKRTKKHSVRR